MYYKLELCFELKSKCGYVLQNKNKTTTKIKKKNTSKLKKKKKPLTLKRQNQKKSSAVCPLSAGIIAAYVC